MIDKNGYFDWADTSVALPDDHRWYGDTDVDIVVCHSMEGVAGNYWFFLDPAADPWKGWHWTVARNGHLWQHAPIWWGLAHGHDANHRGPGGESAGFRGEPLTAAQVKTWRRILRDLAEWKGRPYTLENGKLTEHRDWTDATQCPSERYAPLYAALADERDGDTLTLTTDLETQIEEIVRRVIANEAIEEDERLRDVQFKRNSIEHIANHPDSPVVESAFDALEAAGLMEE